ncbi:MAG TPA: hypothetical protein VHX64_08870, partial [Caulobacteraceae bacterium]|nr:hypothetical protein [Caulobacteraceae bacterium]
GISNNPGSAIWSTKCKGDAPPVGTAPDSPPADYSPYRSFAGLNEGDSPARLFRRLGRPFTISSAGDFYNYWSTPLTLEVEDGHVAGFSIGTDRDTVGLQPAVHVELTRDPATCRIIGYRLRPEGPGEG